MLAHELSAINLDGLLLHVQLVVERLKIAPTVCLHAQDMELFTVDIKKLVTNEPRHELVRRVFHQEPIHGLGRPVHEDPLLLRGLLVGLHLWGLVGR